ncbi:hypothetical protein SNE40_010670 [Patella caerulea]|uniref:Uncharacterized protein n=1 Tax=Patella caerulea TaxID=87958 RepID=A0AAN8JSG4_PATCE
MLATGKNVEATSSPLSSDLSDDEDYVNLNAYNSYSTFSSSSNESCTSSIDQLMYQRDTDEELSDISSLDSNNEDDEHDPNSQYIYNDCKQTYLSSYMMIMLLVTKHSLSKEVFTDLLKFTASH